MKLRGLNIATLLLPCAVALLVSHTAAGFSIPVHLNITQDELEPLSAEVNGRTVGFSDRALEQIGDANEAVDSIVTLSAALFKPERHFTNEEFDDSTQRLLDLREEILELVRNERRNGHQARARLGQALHTIQDFYSHSNWPELGNMGINDAFGEETLDDPPLDRHTCPDDPNTLGPDGGGGITSSYFVGFSIFPSRIGCDTDQLPEGKCFHGNYSEDCIGINKDLTAAAAAEKGVPFNPHHGAAVSSAEMGTRVFVQGILDELAGEDKALAALLDVRGSLGFVIDDTGSMGPEIDGVRNTVSRVVDVVTSIPDLAPDDYVLVRFGDPNVGSAFVTEDPDALLNAVSNISPSGGGDCPELAQAGLLEAIGASFVRSTLHFFSDASSKDGSLANQVIARAQDKDISIIYMLTGSCSPIDPAYRRAAEETGGQVFLVNSGEIEALFELIRPQLEGDLNLIARHKGELGAGGADTVTIPVDTTVTGLVVSVSVDTKDAVNLIRPSGEPVTDSDGDVTTANLISGQFINVDAPQAGEWRLDIEGSGSFTAAIKGNSPIALSRFDFVEPNEDIHGGFFPIPGQPVEGSDGLGEAVLLGPYGSADFELVDEFGDPLADIGLSQDFPDANPFHFLGGFDVPTVPFRVSVSGVDAEGFPYQRQYPVVYRAQPILVTAEGVPVLDVSPGSQATADFTVTNLGEAGHFDINASDELDFVTSVQPTLVSLGMGESAQVAVQLDVPQTATSGESSRITLTATRTDDASVFNSAITVANVEGNRPPDCSAADETAIVLWPPDHEFEAVDVQAAAQVSDPDGDEVETQVLAITQDEPVKGPGSGATTPDARGVGTNIVELRAERSGNGNGRVYAASFEATDTQGASCEGSLRVEVPRDQHGEAIDDGQLYDSTEG